jgi:hypothetical protein
MTWTKRIALMRCFTVQAATCAYSIEEHASFDRGKKAQRIIAPALRYT